MCICSWPQTQAEQAVLLAAMAQQAEQAPRVAEQAGAEQAPRVAERPEAQQAAAISRSTPIGASMPRTAIT